MSLQKSSIIPLPEWNNLPNWCLPGDTDASITVLQSGDIISMTLESQHLIWEAFPIPMTAVRLPLCNSRLLDIIWRNIPDVWRVRRKWTSMQWQLYQLLYPKSVDGKFERRDVTCDEKNRGYANEFSVGQTGTVFVPGRNKRAQRISSWSWLHGSFILSYRFITNLNIISHLTKS